MKFEVQAINVSFPRADFSGVSTYFGACYSDCLISALVFARVLIQNNILLSILLIGATTIK